MARERAVGIVALLLVATLGTTASAQPPDYELLYSERVSEFVGQGTLAEDEARAFRFVVSQPNVTSIDFVLTWTETGDRVRLSKPDIFSLGVEPPAGFSEVYQTQRSNDGELHLRADRINELPEGGPLSAGELEATLHENEGYNGLGDWVARVHLESVGNPDGAKVDEGNDFTLTVYLHHYEGVPMRVVTLSKPVGLSSTTDLDLWIWGLGTLTLLAALLGVVLVRQEWRARKLRRAEVSRQPVTESGHVSPEGNTRTSFER